MANTQVTVRDTQLEKQRTGYINLNLTALDTTSVPDITAGSVVEVGGSLYSFTSDETPSGWSGIEDDTQAYIKLVPGASDVTSSFVTTAPTYSSAKGGWYSGDDRYVARVYKDASGNAVGKTIYVQLTNSVRVPRDLDVGNNLDVAADVAVQGSSPFSNIDTLTSGSSWTVPANVYHIKATIIGAGGEGGSGYGSSSSGVDGGSTSFNGVTASGGFGGISAREDKGGHNAVASLCANNGGMGESYILSSGSDAWATGANGLGGEIKIVAFSVSPGDSISYSLGSGGSGNTSGGDGADGIVIVEY